jgi:hypothetical protein
MKATLIKRENHYDLFEGTRFISTTECEDGTVNKLSKQNCDEIFGVVDVEKLEIECIKNTINQETGSDIHRLSVGLGFKKGFNKAMELQKDKLFTLEQVLDAFYAGWISKDKTYPEAQKSYKGYLERHVMQPTEIEVEIEMQSYLHIGEVVDESYPKDFPTSIPKLDKNGCLILKKFSYGK